MDVVTLGMARANSRREDARLRARDILGVAALPTVNASVATVGASAAATAIANPQRIRMDEPGAFTYLGGKPTPLTTYPDYDSYGNTATYTAGTSSAPWAAECWIDTASGQFEVSVKSTTNKFRLLIDGQYVTETPTATGSGSSQVYYPVTVSAGRHRLRVEMDGNTRFFGLVVGPTDTVRATKPPARRMLFVGDSFSEPTVNDTSFGWDGYPQRMSYMLGGAVDVWSCAIGGTGYLNTSGGTKPTFRQRSADWVNNLRPGDVVVFAGGINDYGSNSAAAIGAEALECFKLIPAGVDAFVVSPFWRNGVQTFVNNLLATRDAIKASADARGLPFLDVLTLPVDNPVVGTLQADTAVNANTVNSDVKILPGSYFQVGTGTNAEVKRVGTVVGSSAPYQLQFGASGTGVLQNTHTAGETIRQCGPCIYTGTGRIGNLKGDGNSDRYNGSDGTHPTAAGHLNIGIAVQSLMTRALTLAGRA